MTPSEKQIALGLSTAALIIGGIAYGLIVPERDSPLHVRRQWPTAVPASVACADVEVRGPSKAWGVLFPDAPIGPGLARCRVCADQSGEPPEATLPDGVWPFSTTLVPYVDGMAQLECWARDSQDAPAGCACAPLEPGPTPCEWLRPGLDGPGEWVPAPLRTNLDPGSYRGGCVPKPVCLDGAGPGTSLPVACGGAAAEPMPAP